MPRPCFSCPVCFQPPCAHRGARGWLQDVLRDRELRSGRVLCVGVASTTKLHGLEAVSNCGGVLVVPFQCCYGALDGDFELAMVAFNEWYNVETRPSAAYGGCLYMPAACSVGPKVIGGRERAW